jgi:predicted  nucleic acid-binding Zn-ribbon protein
METSLILGKLVELQGILSEKYKYEEKIRRSPQQLSNLEELLERLKKEYIEKNGVYESSRERVNRLKVELFEAESNRERGERGMDNITSHREFEALDKEIKEAKDQEQKIRKELLREEKNLSDLKEDLAGSEQMIQSQEGELNTAKAKLSSEVGGYTEILDKLVVQEKEISVGVPEEIIFKFERIMKSDRIINSRDSKGIVAVRGNVCDGCHMILPAQFANEVHGGSKITFCPYCSRILFYEESEAIDSEFLQGVDTGSLSDFESDFADEIEEIEEAEEPTAVEGEAEVLEEIGNIDFDA